MAPARGLMKLFLLTRVFALAQIAQGFLRFFGIKTTLALRVAKKLGRERYRQLKEEAAQRGDERGLS